jgi:hypothetical protein
MDMEFDWQRHAGSATTRRLYLMKYEGISTVSPQFDPQSVPVHPSISM